jgi:topoisomerase-4 subunit A
MSEFDSNLSFYIPMVFPKHANVDFVTEAFHDAKIGEITRVNFEKSGNGYNKYYKAYVYFNWIENDMAYGIQSHLLNNKQTYFTFNNRIRNGYWIIKKNKKEDIDEKNKNIVVSCYESIISDKNNEIDVLKRKLISSQRHCAASQRKLKKAKKQLNESNKDDEIDYLYDLIKCNESVLVLTKDELNEKSEQLEQAESIFKSVDNVLKKDRMYFDELKEKYLKKDDELNQVTSKLLKAHKRLNKIKRKLEKSENNLREASEEHETDIEFFENKIADLQNRVHYLETYFDVDEVSDAEGTEDEEDASDAEETDTYVSETDADADEDAYEEEQEDADASEAEAEAEAEADAEGTEADAEGTEADAKSTDEAQEEADAEGTEGTDDMPEPRIVKEDTLAIILSAYGENDNEETDEEQKEENESEDEEDEDYNEFILL